MQNTPQDSPKDAQRFAHIKGWGSDLPQSRRPAVPMEHSPPRLDVQPGPPAQQPVHVEVLHSNERPGITPLFGSTLPPRGLSGALRRQAFRRSENDLRHWLMLLAADRVDMVEGLVGDLLRGHVPRIYAEMGGRAEMRHNPAGTVKKAVGLLAVVGVACWLMKRRGRV
ncbi:MULTISPECIES: hypothetical protein [unclassified Roseateles]|uniref:hypothetical protein n=1 Tax=unclassified Roseateles TaxID=2626991 RepID=UPI0006F52B40|nr:MULTISPECIES: hypothetical protein [unclassified Roseateles]KQW43646.1 hypothetical protein ASC81_17985 [Pelomonas sp. Root405]KRA71384.1 hypothetical protein ASD88_16505 [Pelomonas sp. Root662]